MLCLVLHWAVFTFFLCCLFQNGRCPLFVFVIGCLLFFCVLFSTTLQVKYKLFLELRHPPPQKKERKKNTGSSHRFQSPAECILIRSSFSKIFFSFCLVSLSSHCPSRGDPPSSKNENLFVCVCVYCGPGSLALAVIGVMAARSLAKPLTSAPYKKLITQTFIVARCVGVLSDQTKLDFLDSMLNFKNSSYKHTHGIRPPNIHMHANTCINTQK